MKTWKLSIIISIMYVKEDMSVEEDMKIVYNY